MLKAESVKGNEKLDKSSLAVISSLFVLPCEPQTGGITNGIGVTHVYIMPLSVQVAKGRQKKVLLCVPGIEVCEIKVIFSGEHDKKLI